jgi:hypothetical protein
MTDLNYPAVPGHRGVDTSIAAAADVIPHAGRLQRLVLGAIKATGAVGRTSDELAAELAIDRGTIQPRTSELRAKRLIADSGQRRQNAKGKACIVWVAREQANG